jgi:hypothetical protein
MSEDLLVGRREELASTYSVYLSDLAIKSLVSTVLYQIRP